MKSDPYANTPVVIVVWRGLAVLVFGALVLLLFTPDIGQVLTKGPEVFGLIAFGLQNEFLAHLGLFAGLTVVVWLGWGHSPLIRVVVSLIGLAVMFELGQIWVPNRSAHISDLLANLLGLSCGIAVIAALKSLGTLLSSRRAERCRTGT